MTDFNVPVRVDVPAGVFRTLNRLAVEHHTTVAELVLEAVKRQVQPSGPERIVIPSGLTVEQVTELRRLKAEERLSDTEIAARMRISFARVRSTRRKLQIPGLPGSKNERRETI